MANDKSLVSIYSNRQRVNGLPCIKGDPLKYEDLTNEQKAELRGIAIEVKTESEYAALSPESGVLYIVTADTE